MPRNRTEWRPCSNWQPIIDELVRKYGVCLKDLRNGWKSARYVRCRYEIWWSLNKLRGISLSEIGRRLGGFHHTSVMHGVRMFDAMLAGEQTHSARRAH